jgi:Uma2 family endonuclease
MDSVVAAKQPEMRWEPKVGDRMDADAFESLPKFATKKVQFYLTHATKPVWIIDPRINIATLYRADGSVGRIQHDGILKGEDVLPGFNCILADIL